MDTPTVSPQMRTAGPYARLDDIEPNEDRRLFETPREHKGNLTEHKACKCKSLTGRKLVVCIDGTSNKFGRDKNTNVIRLYDRIEKTESQLTYYNSGIGTYAKPSYRSLKYLRQIVVNKIDLAIAWNLEKVILGAYRWLSENYKKADSWVVGMTGFSRGAYQVRVLAGMIEKVGLLFPGNQEQIPFAYELYADSKSGGNLPRSDRPKRTILNAIRDQIQKYRGNRGTHNNTATSSSETSFADTFKNIFSRPDVHVHFVGAWDTVSSVGIFRGKPLSLTETCDHVCYFRHALALDERRVKFLPEYVRVNSPSLGSETTFPPCKEVWFAGSHSEIGGAKGRYAQLRIADPPLLWMENEAQKAGLHMRPSDIKQDDWTDSPKNSLTPMWWLLEVLPFLRLSYDAIGSHGAILPNFGRGRTVRQDQKIHASVAFKPQTYHPAAVLLDCPLQWEDLVNTAHIGAVQFPKSWMGHLEMDLFDNAFAKDAFKRLESHNEQENPLSDLDRLITLAWSLEGCHAILEIERSLLILLSLVPKPKVRQHSIRLLHLLAQHDHGQPMAGAEEELVTMFSRLGRRGTVDEVLRKLLEPRPEHPRMQFAALSLMLLLTRQDETQAVLWKTQPAVHLVQLLKQWMPTADGTFNHGILELLIKAIAHVPKTSQQTNLILMADGAAPLIQLLNPVSKSTPAIHERVVEAIICLSRTSEQADSFLKAGVVPYLIQLLNVSPLATVGTVEVVAKALAHIGDVADRRVAAALEAAVDHISDHHLGKSVGLSILSHSFLHHFECYRDTADLNKAIMAQKRAIQLTPDDHVAKPALLGELGRLFLSRFEWLGNFDDIEKAIMAHENAVQLTPDSHPNKPHYLHNLGFSLQTHYWHLGNVSNLDKAIIALETAERLTPDDHPDKSGCLNTLGLSLQFHFVHLGDVANLDKAILVQENAVQITPDGHPDRPGILNNLGLSLHFHFEHSGDMADLDKAILVQESAVQLTPDGYPEKPGHLHNLSISLQSRYRHLGDIAELDKAIVALESAVQLTPDGHPHKPSHLTTLGLSLQSHFMHSGDIAELDKAILAQQNSVQLTPDDHPDKPIILGQLSKSLLCHFEQQGNLADIEEAIELQEKAVQLTPDNHPSKPIHLTALGLSLQSHFIHFGDIAELDKAILAQKNAVQLTPDNHPHKPTLLGQLGRSLLSHFEQQGNLADVEEAIEIQEKAVQFTDGNQDKPSHLTDLGLSLQSRFKSLGDISDIEKAIVAQEAALQLTPDDHQDKPALLERLGRSFLSRFEHLGGLADIEQAIEIQKKVVQFTPDGHLDKPGRLKHLFTLSLLSRPIALNLQSQPELSDFQLPQLVMSPFDTSPFT